MVLPRFVVPTLTDRHPNQIGGILLPRFRPFRCGTTVMKIVEFGCFAGDAMIEGTRPPSNSPPPTCLEPLGLIRPKPRTADIILSSDSELMYRVASSISSLHIRTLIHANHLDYIRVLDHRAYLSYCWDSIRLIGKQKLEFGFKPLECLIRIRFRGSSSHTSSAFSHLPLLYDTWLPLLRSCQNLSFSSGEMICDKMGLNAVGLEICKC